MKSTGGEEAFSRARDELKHARTILIKVGTEIVHSPDGLLAMGQIGALVEQIAALHMQGHSVILVSSGSVSIGKMVLRRQYLLSGSMQAHLGGRVGETVDFYDKACAAAGQSGLQSLYEMLFAQYHLACSQILASDADFRIPSVRENLRKTVRTLLDLGVIPVINENDVISSRKIPILMKNKIAWDNDSLASLFAFEIDADLLVILTDVDGVFELAEDGKTRTLIHEFTADCKGAISPDSRVGPVGQKEKLHSCIRAVDSGAVRAAVLAKAEPGVLLRIINGDRIGTLFAWQNSQRTGQAEQEGEYIDPVYSGIALPTSKL